MSFVPPSGEEVISINLLKQQLYGDFDDVSKSDNFSDTMVLRFLRGHKGCTKNAHVALKQHVEWRRTEGVDHLDQRRDEFQRELNSRKALLGFRDRNGRPGAYVYAHHHNAYDRDIEELRKLSMWVLESLRREAKREEERFVVCLDLGKFTMRCMDYEAVRHQVNILQSHYPDTLESCYVIDAPFIFNACWRVIRPWLDPVTASKVQFIKKIELEKHFDLAIIPPERERP
jgi:hypothetical protein